MEPKYKRILLKLSGEALAGDQHFGLNHEVIGPLSNRSSRSTAWAYRWGLLSAAAIFGVGVRARIWTARPPIIWGCWQQ